MRIIFFLGATKDIVRPLVPLQWKIDLERETLVIAFENVHVTSEIIPVENGPARIPYPSAGSAELDNSASIDESNTGQPVPRSAPLDSEQRDTCLERHQHHHHLRLAGDKDIRSTK